MQTINMQISTNEKSVIFFFNSPKHRQLPDVKELPISVLAEDGVTKSKEELLCQKFTSRNQRCPHSATRNPGNGTAWKNNLLKKNNLTPNRASGSLGGLATSPAGSRQACPAEGARGAGASLSTVGRSPAGPGAHRHSGTAPLHTARQPVPSLAAGNLACSLGYAAVRGSIPGTGTRFALWFWVGMVTALCLLLVALEPFKSFISLRKGDKATFSLLITTSRGSLEEWRALH